VFSKGDKMALDQILERAEIGLNDVYKVYSKWIYTKNLRRIDIGLAMRLIAKTYGTRVWLIFVGASGDWKTEQIRALEDPTGKETKVIRNMTAKTLVNGNPRCPDLAPNLRDKCVLFPDMAQLLKLNPNEKGEVWAQLRDLYDGFAGKQSGLGKDVEYKDLNITLVGASTPAIDKQILIHQDLGTRELLWRTEDLEKTKIMEMVLENEKAEELMRLELNKVTNLFLSQRRYNPDIFIPEEVITEIKYQALLLTFMRAPADIDPFSGELIQDVYPEQPSRVLKQLKKIYLALKSLDPEYSDIDALEIIQHIVYSSSNKLRHDVLLLLINNLGEDLSTNKVAERLKIGVKTAFKELNALWNLGLIHRKAVEEIRGVRLVEFCLWCPNLNHDIVNDLCRIYKPDSLDKGEESV